MNSEYKELYSRGTIISNFTPSNENMERGKLRLEQHDYEINLPTAIPGKKMRPISVQWAGLSRADGSAKFGFGRFVLPVD